MTLNAAGRTPADPWASAAFPIMISEDDHKTASEGETSACPKERNAEETSIAVAIVAEDKLTYEGAVAALGGYRQIEVVPPEHGRTAQVLVAFEGEVTERTLMRIEQITGKQTGLQVLLVANSVSEPRLMRAIGMGVGSVLLRNQTTFSRLAQAVVAVYQGEADFPQLLLGPLIRHVRRLEQRGVGVRLGLSSREIAVLGLLADGMDTVQIARQLNYSERTIKGIVHAIIANLGVSNRTHAVAYVIRAGLL
ncbi:helix-turn-helix transcriptional regulator [Streptomyces mirabilis]|uniref:helix-turn-helix transcriptional regulator n=1 Tax=Streptomyces mirabilis TaxID=68239 RepID=UPI0033B90ACA